MTLQRRSLVGRDQATTPFGATLLRLCDGTGAMGAALVDYVCETVDYAGTADPYDIRVAAAEWRLILRLLQDSPVPNWPDTYEMLVAAKSQSFAVAALLEGYAIVLQLLPYCFKVSPRAINEAVREISREAGLDVPADFTREHWSRVEVKSVAKDRRRPQAVWIGSSWSSVELLGRYDATHLERGEVGYRARLGNGEEVNLVRERMGRWYAEDLLSS